MEIQGEGNFPGCIDGSLYRKEEVVDLPTPEDVQKFIMSLFKNWTEGPIGLPGQNPVTLNSRRKDFFPADRDMCALSIGIDIDEKYFKFNRDICFAWSMPDHSFTLNGKHVGDVFHKKYQKEKIPDQTMKEFIEMVYDLILIQNGRPFS